MDESEQPSPATQSDVIGRLLDDCADRVRRLPESRLNKVAGSAGELAQLLADAAAGIERRGADEPPESRTIPTVSVFAVGDQIAVTARDLTAATVGLSADELVWCQNSRQPLASVLRALHEAAEGFRAQL
jgi:hypothetical protein